MTRASLTERDLRGIKDCIDTYRSSMHDVGHVAKTVCTLLIEHTSLQGFVHSAKFRAKTVRSLRDKLKRIALERRGEKKEPTINAGNLFEKIHDLAGVRLLHLHTQQVREIMPRVLNILGQFEYKVLAGPKAYTWDEETKNLFEEIRIPTEFKPELYTSVHLVLRFNKRFCCELQIRTLMEEVWGEVSHAIDYPNPCKSLACREQLKVLARTASAGTRLVDSIFVSAEEHKALTSKKRR
jgi:putative GTP pyrophosphokinase